MLVREFYASVAGMVFRYRTSAPRGFADGEAMFRGFGVGADCECSDVVDVRVELVDRVEDIVESGGRFVADSHGMDTCTPFRWTLDLVDGREYVTVRYGRHEEGVGDMQLIVWDAHRVEIRVEDCGSGEVMGYSFPAFNIMLSRLLLRRGGFLIHSSVVSDMDGRGYLFTAPSGTGKSTMARIWLEYGADMVNDDMIAIRISDQVMAYNIPMPHYSQSPKRTPLHAIFLLSQSPYNTIKQLTGAIAIAKTAANVIQQPIDHISATNIINAVTNTTLLLNTYSLAFKPDHHVVDLIRDLNLHSR